MSHFRTLERTMVRALDMAEDGVFLTPLTQPEMQGVRAWLYEQVAAN